MAKARFVQDGQSIDHTPLAAVTAGDVVVVGTVPLVAKVDIAANALGALSVDGVFDVVKDTSAFSAGDAVYWDENGSPVGGVALSGAASSSPSGNHLMGLAIADAGAGATAVRVKLTAAKRTATIAGSVTADDVTGSDSSLGIAGKAGSSGAGGAVAVVGGAGDGAAGGAITVTGGAGGADSAGGAVTIAGGVPASGNANGGASGIAGGAGSGTGTGGAASVTSGASAGATGTAGNVNIDCGAAAGGTPGTINIGAANAGAIALGKMPSVPSATVAAAGSSQSDAAAIAAGFTLVTAANGTKGVKLPAAAAGSICIVKNIDAANAVLKVYPNTDDAINAIAANGALSMAAKTSAIFVAYDATTWYTIPLLPS